MKAFVIIGLVLAALIVTACSTQPATPSQPSQPTAQSDQATQQTANNAVNTAVVDSNDTTQLGSIV